MIEFLILIAYICLVPSSFLILGIAYLLICKGGEEL